jgi:hypothetical protein
LANLNEFNKKMHMDNCKIRKTIEGTAGKNKMETTTVIDKNGTMVTLTSNGSPYIEMGDQCIYCSRLFVNLSEFNKRLHFEHCKLKKRILAANGGIGIGGNLTVNNLNNSLSSPGTSGNNILSQSLPLTSHSLSSTSNNGTPHHHSAKKSKTNPSNELDLGDSCIFCSRSLLNLSNFNKRIHIETCKTKKMKNSVPKEKHPGQGRVNGAAKRRSVKKEKELVAASANSSSNPSNNQQQQQQNGSNSSNNNNNNNNGGLNVVNVAGMT